MNSYKKKMKNLRKLISEIVKSPKNSPYKLSYALAAKSINMSPQAIYYYLKIFDLKSIDKRIALQAAYRKISPKNKK